MAYEIRKVPAQWQHPKDENGEYVGLFESSRFKRDTQRWDEENDMWSKGMRSDGRNQYVAIEPKYQHMSYVQWTQQRPVPEHYMPQWRNEERTHFQVYEDVTEGTPVSPVFDKAIDLLNWVIEANAKEGQDPAAEADFWKRWVLQQIKAANLTCGIVRGCGRELER